MSTWQRFAGTDPVLATKDHDDRMHEEDARAEWADFILALLDEECGPLIDDDVTEGVAA